VSPEAPARRYPPCPFCGSADVELVSPWGGQLITTQLHCRACRTHFEALRQDFEAPEEGGPVAARLASP
jgi:hypothetical protein